MDWDGMGWCFMQRWYKILWDGMGWNGMVELAKVVQGFMRWGGGAGRGGPGQAGFN